MRFPFEVLPQIVPFELNGAEQINLDEMLSATCTVSKGDIPLTITWTHTDTNGVERELSTDDGIVITRTNQRISILSIEAVKARHRGNYSCIAKNRGGIASHSGTLFVNGEDHILRSKLNFAICGKFPCSQIRFSHLFKICLTFKIA